MNVPMHRERQVEKRTTRDIRRRLGIPLRYKQFRSFFSEIPALSQCVCGERSVTLLVPVSLGAWYLESYRITDQCKRE
jgi:hypothetical protein